MPVADAGGSGTYVLGSVQVPKVEYYNDIIASAQRYKVRPELLAAALKQESNFDPTAVSPAGAIGIAQFMPQTAQSEGVNPTDPASSIDGMAKLLSQYQAQFGSESLALAAYNAGPGAVEEAGNKVPNIAETQNYVNSILAMAGGDSGADTTAPSSGSPGGLSAIVHFFDDISSAAFWRRVGIGVLGALIIFFAVRQLMPNAVKQIEAPVKKAAEAAAVA